MTDRHYGVDWLRIGAFGLLILYHIGMFFVPWDWHVKTAHPIDGATLPMMAVNPWRLALLFAVSGYASCKLMTKLSGPGGFAASRTARLLVPLIFGVTVIVPPQAWVELMFKHGYAHGFTYFWMQDYFRLGALHGIILPTWNHLWFVVYLWAYSMLLALILLAPARVRNAAVHGAESLLSGRRILIVPLLLLALRAFVLFPGADETHALVDDWGAHAAYFPIFLFGYLLAQSDTLWRAIRSHWKAAGLLAILSYAVVVTILFDGPAGSSRPEMLDMAIEVARIVQAWCTIIALIGLADRFLNRDHPARPMLTEAVFPFYIIHQTIIVLVGWWMIPAHLAPSIQFALLVVATVAGCWIFYRIGRAIPGFRLLIGLKGFRPPPRSRSFVDRAPEGLR
ncbi:acyltransferase family protein [Sphingomonas sp. LaA6.9]|uniref:acyltransferase family protein n=1 Tax=Sphingomonas sp. LaA6.9 TaxID=2919914 RepID=UPI001F501422|nr:acyltransferase family protein [Sphingomonas sp. LaA6.9]MCJ8156281.1 acyltransferase family protein [Sphingomonas sp. LaA6.9]